MLHIERDCARLYKRPSNLVDASRGLPGYDRRRYVLLCLACAVLERADPQITLRVLGDRLLALAAEPGLLSRGFSFTLQAQHERRVLAGMLAAVRGPSTWSHEEAPTTLDERLSALVTEHVADSDEGRRTALRHQLSRRLLDDPVVYLDELDTDLRAYFVNQRGPMAARLCDASGLAAEQRAEGLALVDEDGALTDVAMPAEGTEAHVTLLVAEFLANLRRTHAGVNAAIALHEITAFVAGAKERYGTYWRKSAREHGAEHELAGNALERLQKLQLVACDGDAVQPLPALARFAVGETEIKRPSGKAQTSLFDAI